MTDVRTPKTAVIKITLVTYNCSETGLNHLDSGHGSGHNSVYFKTNTKSFKTLIIKL